MLLSFSSVTFGDSDRSGIELNGIPLWQDARELGRPAHEVALRERDREVERDPEHRGDDDRGPGRREVEDRATELICTPSALVEPPKYSPTTAPIIASTLATFRAAKRNGSAVGMRTRRKISSSLAA